MKADTSTRVHPANEDLTSQHYWEDNWQRKSERAWGKLDWVRRQYNWRSWDEILRRRLKGQNGNRFLEVGCAGGKWLIYFQKTFGYNVTGCDYSPVGCDMARKNLEAAGIDAPVLQKDLFTLTGEFDVIYSHGLIEHFQNPLKVLEKFSALLHPSHGTLISVVPNITGLSGFYNRLFKPETFETHRRITLEELQCWYRDLGLREVEIGALGSFVPFMFPRDQLRKDYPRFYRLFWGLFLHPLTWLSNRICIELLKRFGLRIESQRFSPYLYVIGKK